MAKRLASRVNLLGLAVFAIVVIAWEGTVRSGLLEFDLLPAPSQIAASALELAREGVLGHDTAHTLLAIAISWTSAMLIGVPLGLALGFSSLARRYLLASIEVLRPLPGIAFAPVALLLFGFSLKTELVVTILPSVWPILINTMGGVANVHARLIDVGRTLRLGRAEIVRRLLLPAALPSILVGARVSLGLALVLSIVAEMVGNPEGLGYGIVREQQALNPAAMFAYIVLVGVIGLALNAGVQSLTAALWPPSIPRKAAA